MTLHEQFSDFFSTSLNAEQQQAVSQHQGILLVCAGAGSGKTRLIIARITNLILTYNIPASAIVALTFTNKAAREMKERIIHFLPGMTLPYIGTFHSYCLRLLKVYRHHVKHSEFTIIDEDDKEKMLKSIINKHGLAKKISVKNLTAAISHHKNSLLGVADPLLEELCIVYEKEKNNAHCLDFDDLLLEILTLFKTNSTFKKDFQSKVKHILVDEYQDTNIVQHELLQQMSQDEHKKVICESLCVVGDEDQSIYSWRGATVQNIIHFKRDFPETLSITISQNYRSAQPILAAANAVIEHNTARNAKTLWSTKAGVDRIRIIQCASNYQEGDSIAKLAALHIKKMAPQSIAVLYRSHYQSRSIEEALIRNSIPYTIIGGIRFYDRQEIKDLLAYMRLVVNPFDRISLTRIINTPSRGLGDKFIEALIKSWDEQPFLNGYEVLQHMLNEKIISGLKAENVQSFIALMKRYQRNDTAQQVLEGIVAAINYMEYIKEHFSPEDAQAKIGNVKELINAVAAFERQGIVSVDSFLDDVALMQEHTIDPTNNDFIALMTLHGAKGLEFDTVILSGLEENILPSAHATYNDEGLQEERRLLYVGITRARERLLLTYVKYRYVFGSMTDQRASRFMHELPDSIEHTDCSTWHIRDIEKYLYDWYTGQQISLKPTSSKTELVIPEAVFSDEVFDKPIAHRLC